MNLDKKNMKKILLIVCMAILFAWGLKNYPLVFSFLKTGLQLIMPFLIGLALAFIMNVPMRKLEQKMFSESFLKKHPRWKRWKRIICVSLTMICFLCFFALVLFIVVPDIATSLNSIREQIPTFITDLQHQFEAWSKQSPQIDEWMATLEVNWESIKNNLMHVLQTGVKGIVSTSFSVITSFFTGIVNFFMGIVFAIYILLQKETLLRQGKKVLYACFSKERVNKIVHVLHLTNQTFTKFVTGQCTEAFLLGLLCFIGMTICRFPYALPISVLVGLTAFIPIFGAFIGTAVGALLIVITSPIQAFWFIIFILVLQQIEGNLIYPRVVGTSVGLPPMWVMLAVAIGGSLMGIVGMLLSVPLSSILYTLFREWVGSRLKEQKISVE